MNEQFEDQINTDNNINNNLQNENEDEKELITIDEKIEVPSKKSNKSYKRINTLTYRNNTDFQYLDKLIESFSLSKLHLYTLLVCSFSVMAGTYQTTHYFFCKKLLFKKYSWTDLEYSLIFIFQNVIGSIGAFFSVCTPTKQWDINSNVIISSTSLVALILLFFFNDSALFIVVMFIFNYCQGFIYNITYNFLVEEMKIKYREFFFLLCYSMKLIANAIFGILEYVIYDVYENEDPNLCLIGLVFLQFGLVVSLAYFTESPRIMYYNSRFEQFYDYIEYTTIPNVSKYKNTIIKKLKHTKKEIEKAFEPQNYTDYKVHFKQLWEGPYLILSLKSILFIFLSNFLMSNLKDSYMYFVKGESLSLFIIDHESEPHYKITLYYIGCFIGLLILLFIKLYVNPKRIIYSLICLVVCIIFLLLMVLLERYYVYFLLTYEIFANFYYASAYMYFGTYTTSQLRNSMTSLLYIINSCSYIFQSGMMTIIEKFPLFGYMNFPIAIILGIGEIFLIKDDTGKMMCQEIEIKLLRWSKIDKENKALEREN